MVEVEPIPRAGVEARHLAGLESRHARIERSRPFVDRPREFALEGKVAVEKLDVDVEGRVVVPARHEVRDREVLTIGRAVQIRPADEKLPVSA